ncbi:MAG: hypothetical protein ACYDH3_08030, partial [Candidatus Aminicenantales bacterium]
HVPGVDLKIAGRRVEIIALPQIIEDFLASGGQGDEAGIQGLFNRVAAYNTIPAGEENAWKEGLRLEIERRLRKENQ